MTVHLRPLSVIAGVRRYSRLSFCQKFKNREAIGLFHAPDIAAIDVFVAPTIGFDLLYVLVIVRLERRKLVWTNVTPHPTAEWIARQVTEAFPLG